MTVYSSLGKRRPSIREVWKQILSYFHAGLTLSGTPDQRDSVLSEGEDSDLGPPGGLPKEEAWGGRGGVRAALEIWEGHPACSVLQRDGWMRSLYKTV